MSSFVSILRFAMPSSTFSFASSRFWLTQFSVFYPQWPLNLCNCQFSSTKAHVFALNVGMEALLRNCSAILVLWWNSFQLRFAICDVLCNFCCCSHLVERLSLHGSMHFGPFSLADSCGLLRTPADSCGLLRPGPISSLFNLSGMRLDSR